MTRRLGSSVWVLMPAEPGAGRRRARAVVIGLSGVRRPVDGRITHPLYEVRVEGEAGNRFVLWCDVARAAA